METIENLLRAAKHALEFLESIKEYEDGKTANELRRTIAAVEHTLAGGQAGSCPNCRYHNIEIRCRSCGHTYTPAAKAQSR